MDRNQLQPVNGSTHVAIVGTYNKVYGFVKHGPNIRERIEKAIVDGIKGTRHPSGSVIYVDLEKQVITETVSGVAYQSKYPFKLEQVIEY
jgi:hypothetical protein